jgi:hypothetical protein
MKEDLLQFIWKNRFIRNGPYHTIEGGVLEIMHPGNHNFNQGPDFLNARIKLENTEWAGNVEIHVYASQWHKHRHEKDPNFRNIILHVVWVNDIIIYDQSGIAIPTFCLQPYVSNLLLIRYRSLMMENSFFKPCQDYLPIMKQLKWLAWKERLVVERLERKAKKITAYLIDAKQDWETITWWSLASNMGLNVNEQLFESVARSIPLRIISNHRNRIQQLEALFLGQSNLLSQPFQEQYPRLLQREYQYLQKKYRLEKQILQPAYLRMRPASFPTLRLAQLATLLHENDHFFDFFKNTETISTVRKRLMVVPNDYWLYHYRFDDLGSYKEKRLGISMVDSILINTVIPLLFAYGETIKESSYQERALNWLMEIGAERNRITMDWSSYQVINRSSFDSQALIELNSHYCKERRCLDCAIGLSFIGNL